MAAGASRRVSAAAARSHTRKHESRSFVVFPPGFLRSLITGTIIFFSILAFHATKPPPPKLCGSPDGPPVTSSRILLSDGRHLAYKEQGVPKDKANYKIVFVHGFDSCRHSVVIDTTLAPDVVEDLGVYIVSFDRPGYGESDPNPKRTEKSIVFDIEELADQLGLGSKFYIVGYSMGGQAVWACLKYIPHRLAGVSLIAPVVNYWWHNFPGNLSREAYYKQLPQDQWALRVAHYAPWLVYWWNTQNYFPASSVAAHKLEIFNPQDRQLLPKIASFGEGHVGQIRQQGEYESLHRDMMIGFGRWGFDPMDLENPFPDKEGSVDLWHGDEDGLVPVTLQRYIVQKLPWIRYHELPGAGHMFPFADGMAATIIKTLLIREGDD